MHHDHELIAFQYTQETATILANQLLANTTSSTRIAVISAPSAFVQLKNILVSLATCGFVMGSLF
jgi:hypothetical protein